MRSYSRLAGFALILVGIAAANCLAPVVAAAPTAFDPKPWLEDLEQTREAVATKYANLEWVVIEREIDLASLFGEAKTQLQSTSSDVDARAVFDKLARRFGDGHVRFRWSSNQSPTRTPNADCAALGYDERIRGGVTAVFVPGYLPLADAPGNEFPAGIVQVIGHRVGVIKIGIFTPQGMPELCAESLIALKLSPESLCDDPCRDDECRNHQRCHDRQRPDPATACPAQPRGVFRREGSTAEQQRDDHHIQHPCEH